MCTAEELHLRAATCPCASSQASWHRHQNQYLNHGFKKSNCRDFGPFLALRCPVGVFSFLDLEISLLCGCASARGVDSESAHRRSLELLSQVCDSSVGGVRRERSAQVEQASQCARDLQELVLLPLLECHQSARRLVRVAGAREDAPHALLGLGVARFTEEPRERVLADVLEDVRGRALAACRIEAVHVRRRTHPAAV